MLAAMRYGSLEGTRLVLENRSGNVTGLVLDFPEMSSNKLGAFMALIDENFGKLSGLLPFISGITFVDIKSLLFSALLISK